MVDRVILAGQDGALRLAGLALAGTSSHCLSYGRQQDVLCPALLPSPVLRRLAAMMTWRPASASTPADIKTLFTSDLTGDSLKLVATLLDYYGDKLIQFLLNDSIKMSEKLVVISTILGLNTETDVWTMIRDTENKSELARKYDFLVDKKTFLSRQEELCRLHSARAVLRQDRMRLTAQLICLGLTDAAVSLLMEPADQPDSDTMTDQLLACLIQSMVDNTNTQAESLMKMVATNLVSEGKMWEGVQVSSNK